MEICDFIWPKFCSLTILMKKEGLASYLVLEMVSVASLPDKVVVMVSEEHRERAVEELVDLEHQEAGTA